MIDFRYHLVSLISVFLALAVGIVLGAGPLRESLGDTLAGQVEQLRAEQDELRAQGDEAAASRDQLAGLITELGPELVDGTLAGTRVAVLTDDSSTGPAVDAVLGLIDDAGAEAVPITLVAALWEPGGDAARTEAITQLEQIAPTAVASGETPSEQLVATIVALLEADDESALTPELRAQAWQALVDHGLVTVDEPLTDAVDSMLIASAAPHELDVESDDESAAAERDQLLLGLHTRFAEALDESGMPVVIAADTPLDDGTVGLLRTVRGDPDHAGISTTDRLLEADGPMIAVLALVEQTRGGAGSYGTATGADSRVPDLPEMRDPAVETGGADPSDAGGDA